MFVDTRELESGRSIQAQVCIIGAGAAGISMARELASRGHDVCLLESGGFEYAAATQDLYKGENVGVGYDPLSVCRLRYFGGTTNHWAGWTRPLDPIDFERRDWIPYSGWPITGEDLAPFYKKAESVLELGPRHNYDPRYWCGENAAGQLLEGDAVQTRVFRFSPPTRFGHVYRDEIERSGRIRAYLHANVVNIELVADGGSVNGLEVATLDDRRHRVTADSYILATGGIENARLLLASNGVQNNGIGNQHDRVGRFFADHFGVVAGTFVVTRPAFEPRFYSQHPASKADSDQVRRIQGAVSLDEAVLRREQLANFGGLLREKNWAYLFKEWLAGGEDAFSRHIGAVAGSIDDMLVDGYRKLFAPDRRDHLFEIVAIMEPQPNPDSRVSLSGETDALGLPRVKLDWRLSEGDRRAVERTRRQLGLEFGRAGLGRLLLDQNDQWLPDWMEYGRHHMGTTRMHDNPAQGVVDADCRVHGVKNLYIAGSSVFPTYGYAQPTYTIVALALRLADHLDTKVLT